jgi:hypothetical protein
MSDEDEGSWAVATPRAEHSVQVLGFGGCSAGLR